MKDKIVTITLDQSQWTELIEALNLGAGSCEVWANRNKQDSYNAKAPHWRQVYAAASERWKDDTGKIRTAERTVKDNMKWEVVE